MSIRRLRCSRPKRLRRALVGVALPVALFAMSGTALAAPDGRDIKCTPNAPGGATAGTCEETIDVEGEPPPPPPLTPPAVPHANTGQIGTAPGGTNGVDGGGTNSDTDRDNCGTDRVYIPCGVVDADPPEQQDPPPQPCGQPSGGTPSGPVEECDAGTPDPPSDFSCQTAECCESKAETIGTGCEVLVAGCALVSGPAALACGAGGVVVCEAGEKWVEGDCVSRLPQNKQTEPKPSDP